MQCCCSRPTAQDSYPTNVEQLRIRNWIMILSVNSIHEEGDRDLERRVTAFLAGRNVPALRRLYVRSSQGVVTLRGHVRTFYEKQLGGSVPAAWPASCSWSMTCKSRPARVFESAVIGSP